MTLVCLALLGACTQTKQQDTAKQLIQYMTSPAAVPLLALTRVDPAK